MKDIVDAKNGLQVPNRIRDYGEPVSASRLNNIGPSQDSDGNIMVKNALLNEEQKLQYLFGNEFQKG
jgi:hypothetical protein